LTGRTATFPARPPDRTGPAWRKQGPPFGPDLGKDAGKMGVRETGIEGERSFEGINRLTNAFLPAQTAADVANRCARTCASLSSRAIRQVVLRLRPPIPVAPLDWNDSPGRF
jgi:hypothetical protein